MRLVGKGGRQKEDAKGMRTHWVATIVSASLLSAFACGNDDGTGPDSSTRVVAISSPALEGTVGAAVSGVPTVWVTGRDGNPLKNVTIEFLVHAGSVATPIATTDADGIAKAGAWVLATRPGPNILSVRLAGVERLQFVATGRVGIPTSLRSIWPTDEQAGLVGEVVRAPEVLVRDQYSNPGTAAVTFAISEGGGIVTGAVALPDARGYARPASWVLGQTPGRNSLTASVPGVASVTFVAQALDPATLTWFTLDGIRAGDKLWKPADFYIGGAKLALAHLDGCLCRQQADYFIEVIQWSWSGLSDHNSGRYQMDGPSSPDSPGLLIGTEAARFEGDTLLIGRYDLDFGFPITWVYRMSKTAP
jgi:hypothetical protein